MFRKLFGRDASSEAAADCYDAIVRQARLPDFYLRYGVPDSLDGRFDVLVLHAVLVFVRLSRDKAESERFSQALFDRLFADMDLSLREIGVSDISVGKKVKQMGKAFYGRLEAYRAALQLPETEQAAALAEALRRNLFRGTEGHEIHAREMAAYVLRQNAHLATLPTEDVMGRKLVFAAP